MKKDGRPETELDGETLDRSDQETRARGDAPPRPFAGRRATLAAGQAFGGYRLVRVLGKGGFGQVWEAESLETGRRLALKVLTEAAGLDEDTRQRFEREGRLAAAVSHSRCVYVFGAEEIDGHPVISMELVAGGTLQDEVKRRGALPFREAVDRILDVLEGLEAAYAKGVIHRDVKPSNCFLDAAGRAKVGDFGLSRTLEVDTKLTTTGVFLGTPAYSSPEQVRAQALDFRADLYSAGATLYTLLAGDVPFQGTQLGPVLARILSEPPPPIGRAGVTVPGGLERVVQRFMAKERDKRYGSYAAARAALLPYSSQGLSAASVAKRFAAGLVDHLVMTPLGLLFMAMPHGIAWSPLAGFVYFLALEGAWGRSLGKRLFRLSVVDAAGGDAGWGAVALRTAAYTLFTGLPVWPRLFIAPERAAVYQQGFGPPLMTVVAYLLLSSTMRRRNGYAGIHEQVSRTRVVALPERSVVSAPRAAAAPPAAAGPHAPFGPFVVESVVWEAGGESVALGVDPVLHRPLFVHGLAAGQPARAISALAEGGPGRLRWLQGAREQGRAWDAFEAPGGLAFRDWVQSRGRLSWSGVAGVLATLAPELERGDGAALSLDRVWVDETGQGRLLDFTVRDPSAADAAESFPAEQWRAFLRQLVLLGLEGRLVPSGERTRQPPRVPLAERARAVVEGLFAEPGLASPRELGDRLAAIAGQPAEVNVARRGVALAIAGTVPAFGFLVALMTVTWGGPVTDLVGMQMSLGRWHSLTRGQAARADPARQEALERLMAHYYQRLRARAQGAPSGNPMVENLNLKYQLARLDAGDRQLLESVAARHPVLSPSEMASTAGAAGLRPMSSAEMGAVMVLFFGVPAAVLGLLLAGIMRGGLALRLGGIAVQRRDGATASRLRCLGRGLVVWLPLLLPLLVVPLGRDALLGLAAGAVVTATAGALYALVHPTRGLQDLLAGTHLVPR